MISCLFDFLTCQNFNNTIFFTHFLIKFTQNIQKILIYIITYIKSSQQLDNSSISQMKSLKSRYNYDPAQPLSKEYQDAQVFNSYYKCFDSQTNEHYLLSHFKTENKTQVMSLLKKFTSIKDKMNQGMNTKYITKIHDLFTENKQKSLFLILDYVEGGSIIDYIGKIYIVDWKTSTKIMGGILSALTELHKYDITNTFLNLQNIQIDQAGTPKLSFKCMIYKTMYLSPQFRLQHQKSKQGDLYCLGVCWYRMLFGIFPFKTQKNDQFAELVKKGVNFTVQKQEGLFPLRCPLQMRQILQDLLHFNPQQRNSAIQKINNIASLFLTASTVLSAQMTSKLFKSKYIPLLALVDQMDEHEYVILQKKQKKLLKLLVINSQAQQIQKYIKQVVNKYASKSDRFLKIYEYQVISQEYLVIVYSYSGQGTLQQYRNNLGQTEGFTPNYIQPCIMLLKQSLLQIDIPYKFLSIENVHLKNGSPKLKFPPFPTRRQTQTIKKLAASSELSFIAPQILAGKQSLKCDSWSVGVIEYWMMFDQMPKFDSKGTLIINKRQKLSKHKLLYFHNTIQKNPNNRLNALNQQQVKTKTKPAQTLSPLKQDIKANNKEQLSKKLKQAQNVQSPQKPQKLQKTRKIKKFKQAVQNDLISNTSNILPNKIQYNEPNEGKNKQSQLNSKYKTPIIISNVTPLPQKANKFDMKVFDDASEIKSPPKIEAQQKQVEQPQNQTPLIQRIKDLTFSVATKFATLQRSYTKPLRVSIKCLIAIIFYLFLFYFNFFKINGYLIGERNSYEVKVIPIRAFPADSIANVNYTLVTKTPIETYKRFENTTLTTLRDQYKCVLNDYSVQSDVTSIIKSTGFGAYQVWGILIAVTNLIFVCLTIAKFDICKACSITNFDQRKYHTLLNWGLIQLATFTLSSFHYLIYGGLYHIMLQPCLGKSSLPGLEFILKNWTKSWIFRFVWIYIGIAIAYVVTVFLLAKPAKSLHKYLYIALLLLYFAGVGLRGIGKSYTAYQNVFGICGQLLALIIGVCLFIVDAIFVCCSKKKTQQNIEKHIETGSIQDFNRTQQFFFGNKGAQDDLNQK